MSDSPITVRLPLAMLDLLVPDGSTLPLAWVVLLGHREQIQTTPDGRPVYGDVTSWQPILPVSYEGRAVAVAERLGAASLGSEPDQWLWYPATDDGDLPITELWGVVDGNDVRPEVAIAPLTALLAESQDGGQS
ncbi:hypothetical protein OIE13_22790 [Streptosporangium sp. NBC_01810]|uniref:hypothetical protein n=1 Tax=Streptosporangium sp. NBC_01810 TaxID=2975951 RepID=UPI002DDB8B38|nr:hypothetical protein [Streptosporangium sp. NBC_01810]WSA23773.1 hypothetical protein OIE13_22790 [Streptosporangium sp. NBC_01810]